jgi:hypothetical protein
VSADNDKPETGTESKSSVGYGAPPQNTRFQKGRSGNPRGRPKGSLNVATVFVKTLREKVVINEHGQRRTVTKLEAALKQLVNKAASGDIRALRQLLDLARDPESKQNLAATQDPVLGELDMDVINGILNRFKKTGEPSQDLPEGEHHDDERS